TDGTITSRLEIENPGHQPGFLPCFLAEKGVDVVIAGGMGPRAQDLFTQNGIKHIRGVQGKVEDVIQAFLKNELQSGDDLCSHPHDHGECGPKATSVLNASGVKIVTGAAGTVESWIRKLKMEKADA
ncbi:MAG: hypothetical protein KJ908_05250, partial [Acidobacteria bacterium]|nr:hypothetical protein [Acidobacteriota bacterium]